MAYKDKDKQRETNAERQRRYKAKQKALLSEGVTEDITESVTLEEADRIPNVHLSITGPKRGKDIKCFADLPADVQQSIERRSIIDGIVNQTIKANRTAIAISYQHTFGAGAYYPHGAVCTGVVTGKPGDADYNGICTPEWIKEREGAAL